MPGAAPPSRAGFHNSPRFLLSRVPRRVGAPEMGAPAQTDPRCERQSDGRVERSEEHTSELQSLMRISYAVFCLKKKNRTNKFQRPLHTTITATQTQSHTS